ncbi:unnamed protein product [Parnassius apollo]|uniref:(apollo) hypothetical protein n=1 Tax=Parnassius apollo TaxID=110799 RepID=A0A8S3W3Y0_PARAO|nr:unnamed protein product [Parnassius apollo]
MTDENEEFNINIMYSEDDIAELEVEERDSIGKNTPRIIKRIRETEESDDEWKIVKGKGKKKRLHEDKKLSTETDIEVYIACNEKLPKQFALARLFKENGITDIIRVKYLNPFKVRLQFSNEENVQKLSTCATFISMGWRIQKAMEVNYSYGIIRDVELEMSEEEIMKNLSCPDSTELISVKRLKRRSYTKQEGWCPSETIRLCFKGSSLPSYVYIFEYENNCSAICLSRFTMLTMLEVRSHSKVMSI